MLPCSTPWLSAARSGRGSKQRRSKISHQARRVRGKCCAGSLKCRSGLASPQRRGRATARMAGQAHAVRIRLNGEPAGNLRLACISHSPPKLVAPVSRPAVLGASWPPEVSPSLEFRAIVPPLRNAGWGSIRLGAWFLSRVQSSGPIRGTLQATELRTTVPIRAHCACRLSPGRGEVPTPAASAAPRPSSHGTAPCSCGTAPAPATAAAKADPPRADGSSVAGQTCNADNSFVHSKAGNTCLDGDAGGTRSLQRV
jgi:hypothetical protein